MFENVIRNAKAAREEDIKVHNERTLECELKKKQRYADRHLKLVARCSNTDYKTENYSKELLNFINEHGFEIKLYLKEKNEYGGRVIQNEIESPLELLETYSCVYRNWNFDIKNKYHRDTNRKFFFVDTVYNSRTQENHKTDWNLSYDYVGKEYYNKFLLLLECDDIKTFFKSHYRKYLEIPALLSKNNIECRVKKVSCKLDKLDIIIEVYKNIYVKAYTYLDEIFMVVTNNREYDSPYRRHITRDDANIFEYYLDNKLHENIQELIKCIESFKKHLSGQIGYLEDGNYYSNKDIVKYFESLKDGELGDEKWINGYVIIDFDKNFVHGENEAHKFSILNKYIGVEIKLKVCLTFNCKSNFSIGDTNNQSIITIIYDKNIDSNNCILNIKNSLYKEVNNVLQEEKYEFRDSFSGVMEIVDDYVRSLCGVHDVQV